MALQRANALFPINSTTVDTGTGIDIRALSDTQPGATDNTQSCAVNTQGTNAERTFNPGTADNASRNALNLQNIGWAVPLADMSDGDARCKAVLPELTVTVNMSGTASGTGTGNVGANDVLTPKASLWRWNTSTDTATLIDNGTGSPISISAALAYSGTAWSGSVAIVVSPLAQFEADEVLLVQIGGNLACGAGLLGGARTTTWILSVDVNTTSLNFSGGGGLRQRCFESPTGSVSPGAPNMLTADEAGFETSSAGWTGNMASVARSTAQAHSGAASLLVTRTSGGAGNAAGLSPHKVGVTPGMVYVGSAWVRPNTTARSAVLSIGWYDSSDVLLSLTLGDTFSETGGAWVQNTMYATAPASAARAQINVSWGSVANGEGHYIDDASVGLSSLVRKPTKLPAGSSTPTSTIARMPTRLFAGSSTPSAELVRMATKLLAGSSSSSSVLVRTSIKVLAGSTTPGPGSLTRMPTKLLTASTTPTSTLNKFISRFFTGSTTPTGEVLKTPGIFIEGTITPGPGEIIRTPTKLLESSVTPTPGTLQTLLTKNFRSDLPMSGALTRVVAKYFTGSSTPTGSLGKSPKKFFTGIISGEGGGAVTNIFRRIFPED